MPSITEQFADRQGRFLNYDAYDPDVRTAIHEQSHVDLRTFRQVGVTRPLTIFELNQFRMSDLNALTMTELDNLTVSVIEGEHWTNGTVGPQADRNHWLGLSLPVTAGTTNTQSVMVDEPVDISTGFASTDLLSIALPAFPNSTLNLASSHIELTSNASGDFAAGPTASIPFSASTTTLVTGDSEFTVPLSAITGIDKTKITGVRFVIVATGSATFRVTAIRVLGPNWTYGPVDQDTRYGLLRLTPSRNGSASAAHAYVQPTLWRTGELSGFGDPKPINAKVGVPFNTGSMTATSRISLFMREGLQDFLTQLDLNGLMMADLDGNPQPDFGIAGYATRPQDDLDTYVQGELEGVPQTILERTADTLSARWIEFRLVWGTAPHIEIIDSEGNGYTDLGPITLTANTNYLLVTELVDTTARVYLYETNDIGAITNTVYDTGLIYDSFMLKRVRGRFGWYVDLPDGDAYIDSISSRGLVFAEFRTRMLESITPVDGVELFAAGSAPIQKFENLGAYTNVGEGYVVRDKTRSTTGESWKVVNPGDVPVQGVKSNPMTFTDFENAEIFFDLYLPRAVADQASVSAFLLSHTGVTISLILNRVVPDQWQTHHVSISDLTIQTGTYQLVVVQNVQGIPSTWWIDNVRIFERTLRWQGRIDRDDPWDESDSGWLDFEDMYNRESAGIMFGERGTSIQVRGQAIDQQAFVDKMKIRPHYAELGRLVNPSVVTHFPPTASFSHSDLGGQTVRFNGSASTDEGYIIAYEWAFGDGEIGFGPIVDHHYSAAGIYSVTVVVTDDSGNRSSQSQSVTVA